MRPLKIAQIGMGPLGVRMCRMSEGRAGEEVVSAADMNPDIYGKSLGQYCDIDDTGVRISPGISEAIDMGVPDVAILTTVSEMEAVTPQILKILSHGIPVVSTCEELSFAWHTYPALAESIDKAAKIAGVSVVGTGVNPGFLMDTLPTMLTAVCSKVEFVEVRRFQDAKYRRLPFQQKIGAGLNLEEFESRYQSGMLRHVGLTESLHFISNQLGWKHEVVKEELVPVIASGLIRTNDITVYPGQAAGVRQVGEAYVDGEIKIRLIFQAAVGEPESYDEILIKGEPNFTSRIDGGINGDIATCAITLNTARVISMAKPGLRTMGDIPLVSGLGV